MSLIQNFTVLLSVIKDDCYGPTITVVMATFMGVSFAAFSSSYLKSIRDIQHCHHYSNLEPLETNSDK